MNEYCDVIEMHLADRIVYTSDQAFGWGGVGPVRITHILVLRYAATTLTVNLWRILGPSRDLLRSEGPLRFSTVVVVHAKSVSSFEFYFGSPAPGTNSAPQLKSSIDIDPTLGKEGPFLPN